MSITLTLFLWFVIFGIAGAAGIAHCIRMGYDDDTGTLYPAEIATLVMWLACGFFLSVWLWELGRAVLA